MKTKILFFAVMLFSASFQVINSQSKANDIPVRDLPQEVKKVLDRYVEILNSPTLDDCAAKFVEIAGGGLVNEDGKSLRTTVKPYSLKKDQTDIKFYKQPVEITRVNKTFSNGQGFGASAIKGNVYKIWIAKKDAGQGLPAPISIMVPEGHSTITTPKVVNIGSL